MANQDDSYKVSDFIDDLKEMLLERVEELDEQSEELEERIEKLETAIEKLRAKEQSNEKD